MAQDQIGRFVDPKAVVETGMRAWAALDIDAALVCFAPGAVHVLHVSETALAFGGETVGHAAIRARFLAMHDQFEYLLYRPMNFRAEGDVVRGTVEFMYRHRASGEILSGQSRKVLTVRGGLITRFDEYHDAARIEAFMRLFGTSA